MELKTDEEWRKGHLKFDTVCGKQFRVQDTSMTTSTLYKYSNSEYILKTPISTARIGALESSIEFLQHMYASLYGETETIFLDMPKAVGKLLCDLDLRFIPQIMIRETIRDLSYIEKKNIGLYAISCGDGYACMPDTPLPKTKHFAGHLRSQIRVVAKQMNSVANPKPVNIKLFCTGNMQVACRCEDASDAVDHVTVLVNIMKVILGKKHIDVAPMRTILRNYKTSFSRENEVVIDLHKLFKVFKAEKNNNSYRDLYSSMMTPEIPEEYLESKTYTKYKLKEAQQSVIDRFMRMSICNNPMSIQEVRYDPLIAAGIIVHLVRCRPPRKNKGTVPLGKFVVLIYETGKINIKSANVPEEAREMYIWLSILLKNYPQVLVEKSRIPYLDKLEAAYADFVPKIWEEDK